MSFSYHDELNRGKLTPVLFEDIEYRHYIKDLSRVNALPNDWSKLKAFADDKIN